MNPSSHQSVVMALWDYLSNLFYSCDWIVFRYTGDMDYASSGVNIDAGNNAVDRIKPMVQSTFTPNVLTGLGQFACLLNCRLV